MQNILIISISFILGTILKFVKFKSINIAKILNTLIIYVSLPSLILLNIPSLEISSDTLTPILLPWAVTFITSITTLLIAKRYNFDKKVTGSLLLVGVLGNTSFLGVPMIELFFGKHYITYALLYDQLGSFIILSTYGSVVAAIYSESSSFDIKIIIKKIAKFPPFISLLISFLIRGVHYNHFIISVLTDLSSTLVPFALISVGYQLHLKIDKSDRMPFFTAIFIKTIFSPLVALALCLYFTDMNTIAKVSVLEAGMGPMITAAIMANIAGLSPKLTNAIVGYGILFSFFTLPLFYLLLQSGLF